LAGFFGAPFVIAAIRNGRYALATANALETAKISTASGHGVSVFISVPDTPQAPAVVAIHGSRGLSDWYKSRAQALAHEGFVGLAVDLYDGKVTNDPNIGGALMNEANSNASRTTEVLTAWADWLRQDGRTNGKVGFVGWSFGAWWALTASLATPSDGTVLYYGLKYGTDPLMMDPEAAKLRGLKGPVLGLFAERDYSISKDTVGRFAQEMNEAGKSLEVRWYSAAHSFANPEQPGYDKIAAESAWSDAMAFLHRNLI
jgi:carboxymethylenebutenolidase